MSWLILLIISWTQTGKISLDFSIANYDENMNITKIDEVNNIADDLVYYNRFVNFFRINYLNNEIIYHDESIAEFQRQDLKILPS